VTSSQLPKMACRELVELVTDYLEGRLPPDEHACVDAHAADDQGARPSAGGVSLRASTRHAPRSIPRLASTLNAVNGGATLARQAAPAPSGILVAGVRIEDLTDRSKGFGR
jgi:hypothetical protein